MCFFQTSGVSSAWTRSVLLDTFWSVRELNLMDILCYEKSPCWFLICLPFRWRPSVCRECCFWFSLNSAIFRSSEVCRQRAHAQDLGDIGYVLRIEELSLPLWDLSQCRNVWRGCVRGVVGFWGGGCGMLKGDVCVFHLPCMPGWVHMSACDLPARVDVSIIPLLLLVQSPSLWGQCSSGLSGYVVLWLRKSSPTLPLKTDTVDTHSCFFILKTLCMSSPCSFFSHSKGNKGGVSARMTVFGHPVCFLNCHLPAHMRNLEQRMEDFESILQQQQFDGGTATGVLDHEWVTSFFTFSMSWNHPAEDRKDAQHNSVVNQYRLFTHVYL